MRKLAFLGLAFLVLTSPALIAGDHGGDHAELPEGQAMAAISVSGMSCGACCTKIETAVAKVDGVVKVKADYEKGVAKVVYETKKVDVNQIVKVINSETSFKAKAPKEKAS
jgi:copper chaperone CopZ